ncbi:MAG TPA: hypothetical protein VL175_07370 [Pirellulales bacterium]|jgi:hypothetical protein|nr:hypothetical protein [Pirellulales bacterium]
MDLKTLIGFAIQILAVIGPRLGLSSTLQDKIADLLKAIQDSPSMLTWLQGLLTKQAGIPDNALGTMAIEPADTELQAAWKNASPLLHDWGKRHGGGDSPAGTEGIGIGGIGALIKLLPMLLQLLPYIQQILDLLKNLPQPAPAPSTT